MSNENKEEKWWDLKPYALSSKMMEPFSGGGDDFSNAIMALISIPLMPFIAVVAFMETFLLPVCFVAWLGKKVGLIKIKPEEEKKDPNVA